MFFRDKRPVNMLSIAHGAKGITWASPKVYWHFFWTE
jgi:hypothetical protein